MLLWRSNWDTSNDTPACRGDTGMGFRDLEAGWGIPSKLAEELLALFSFFLPKTLRSEGMIMQVCALK